MPGSSPSQRATRPRTTTLSSTTITRIACCGPARAETAGIAKLIGLLEGCPAGLPRPGCRWSNVRGGPKRGRSDEPDLLELGLDDFLVERLHDVFIGTGVKRARNVADVVLGGAEHHLGL